MQREHPPCVSQLWSVLCQFRGLVLVCDIPTPGMTQVSRSCLHFVFSDALQHGWLWTAVQQRTLENSSLHLTHSPPSTSSHSRELRQSVTRTPSRPTANSLIARTAGVSLHNTPYFPQRAHKPLGRNKPFKSTSGGSCYKPSRIWFWTRNTKLEIQSCPSKHAAPFFTGQIPFVTWIPPTAL